MERTGINKTLTLTEENYDLLLSVIKRSRNGYWAEGDIRKAIIKIGKELSEKEVI